MFDDDSSCETKMSKRRRTSSIASRGQEEDSLDSVDAASSSNHSRKRLKRQQDPMELVQQVYDSIRNFKKEDGSLLCDAFIRVPKRRQEPGYYDVVTNPIDLLKVQQKLKTEEYEDIDDLQSDIELIVRNAKAFYKRTATEYKDANDLWELFLINRSRLYDKDDEEKGKLILRVGRLSKRSMEAKRQDDVSEVSSESSTNPDDEYNQYEDLFTAVMTATDAENNPLHTAFQLLPSKKKYPEYYDVIETPIDLRTIAQKIQNTEYSNLGDMEKDLLMMTKNACLFNEPGSQIYRNAKALKKVITSKKIEVEHGKFQGGKSSERIRNKRLKGSSSLSAVTAALRDDDSEMEMEPEPEPDESIDEDIDSTVDVESPMWQLFETVKSVTNNTGNLLCEPFWRLPSRRFFPDYYKEIKNPVSLTQIRRKLMNHLYGTVSEVAGDLTIMFENAKKYNVPTSKLYRDAVKLQKVMQVKVQELLDIDQDTDSEDLESFRRKSLVKPKLMTPLRGRPPKDPIPLKKRLHAMAKYLLDYVKEDSRKPMLAFMEKPSKKLYPDYYDVISEPIDFIEIESKIKGEQYASEHELIRDFKLMFANCKHYNEENSPIYEDAALLEKVLIEKFGQVVTPERKTYSRMPKVKKLLTQTFRHCRALLDTIRDYREPKANRQLATIFMKLPSKSDYPDYYDIITKPIDLEKISHKLKNREYETLDDLVADFNLMFDNACKYNEPDSQIYKDALVLQRICLQTKLQLKEDNDKIPDVPAAIQDLLLSLFTSVYNHQDTDERCYSDSMSDLPEHDDIGGKKVRALSLDLIKRRLDKGVYKRLDTFQEDFFACLERARQISRSDSNVFEDSVELQTFFIKLRDELCRNGELLHSPALNYTVMNLQTSVETLKQSKMLQESLDDENETRSSDDSIIKETPMNIGESMTCNQQTFKVGDFVYLDAKEKGIEPHVLHIERLWTNDEGQQMCYGNYYLRPVETYHLSTRKFIEKEVFKSDTHVAIPLEEVKGRCCVLNFKNYFTMKPEGFDDKDVFVCESRYSTRARSFKRIKAFREALNVVLSPRETPIEPKRVMSVFRERVEKHKDELAELQEIERPIEKDKPNIVAFNQMDIEDGNTYYEQYNTICAGAVKTGDFVYVATDNGRQTIAQIDTIWETKDGKSYFRGPWFVTPSEVPQIPSRVTYKQELFLSTLEDTNPIVSIVGKCAVLDYNDYISSRLTEIAESDVFICNNLYDEINRQLQKLSIEGLKKFSHGAGVTEDEIYYFTKLINPLKESSPMLTKLNDMDILMEDSIDGPPSVGSGDLPACASSTPGGSAVTPATGKKKVKNKIVSGYILYSRAVRKTVVANNPDSNFGKISRIVGNEWRSLPSNEKQLWEEKATKMNEEQKARASEETLENPEHPDQIFECCWDTCDYQFEEIADCLDHCIKEKDGVAGHVQIYFQQNPDAELHCLWRGCQRIKNKKNSQPFPNVARLVRHVKDLHINKGNGRIVAQENRNKNFRASSKPQVVNRPTPTATPTPSSSTPVAPTPQKQHDPIFISVPPRPQRALHSEAYIKYIEGLHAENKYICNWERTLNVSQESINSTDPERINTVAAWLGSKSNQQDNVLNALWALRNQLLRDTLGLQKTL